MLFDLAKCSALAKSIQPECAQTQRSHGMHLRACSQT